MDQFIANQSRTSENDGHQWLLVSDVDDTLFGDADALTFFIRRWSETPHLLLAINSSRPYESVLRTWNEARLPRRPHAWINAMGTEIRVGDEALSEWARRFGNWDREAIVSTMRKLKCRPHADEFQTPFKASFEVPRCDWDKTLQHIEGLGLDTQVITSGTSDVDIIPAAAGKGAATMFLADYLGVAASRVIVAGDSANDLAMFEAAPKGIVVGNARDELRDAVDGRKAYMAESFRAAGIAEGLEHFAVWTKEKENKS